MGKLEGLQTGPSAAVICIRGGEGRRRLRLKYSRPVPVASEAKNGYVEEVRTTLNVSRDGLYFTTSLEHYRVGMLTAVTFPYSPADPVKMEEIGEVVRVERLGDGRTGIAVRFLLR